MSELEINGMQLSLLGPESLPLAVVQQDSPGYDLERNFFTVSLKNNSDKVKNLPFVEISRSVVHVYRNPLTKAEAIDNRTPPPLLDGAVDEIAPGDAKAFQVVFAYPDSIATLKNQQVVLQFCVKWEGGWLRSSPYSPGAYNWNESFELCREIHIVDSK